MAASAATLFYFLATSTATFFFSLAAFVATLFLSLAFVFFFSLTFFLVLALVSLLSKAQDSPDAQNSSGFELLLELEPNNKLNKIRFALGKEKSIAYLY